MYIGFNKICKLTDLENELEHSRRLFVTSRLHFNLFLPQPGSAVTAGRLVYDGPLSQPSIITLSRILL